MYLLQACFFAHQIRQHSTGKKIDSHGTELLLVSASTPIVTIAATFH